MAEGTRISALQDQVQSLQTQLEALKTDDAVVPKLWDEQRKSIEMKLAENHSYLSKVLELMAKNVSLLANLMEEA